MSSHHIYEMILENCHTCYLFMIGLKVSPEVKVGQREPAPSNKEKKIGSCFSECQSQVHLFNSINDEMMLCFHSPHNSLEWVQVQCLKRKESQ